MTEQQSGRAPGAGQKACLQCSQPISGGHYRINGRPWCDTCAQPYLGRGDTLLFLAKVALFLAAVAGILVVMVFVMEHTSRVYYGAAGLALTAVAFKLFYPSGDPQVEVERVEG